MKTAAFLFDLDGTLADSEPLKGKALALTMKYFGGDVPSGAYKEVMGKSWEEVTGYFFVRSGVTVALDVFDPVFRKYYEGLLDSTLTEKEGLRSFLEFSRSMQMKMALVTSASGWMTEKILKKLSLSHFFDVVVTREDVSLHKPSPDAYLLALEKLEVLPSDTVIFEDSESGVLAAQAAGCRFVFVRHEFNLQHSCEGAYRVIDSFKELAEGTPPRLAVESVTPSSFAEFWKVRSNKIFDTP